MTVHGFCPQCNSEIPRSRLSSGYAICECGWFDVTPSNNNRKKEEQRVVVAMVAATIIMALSLMHYANWGSHAFSIPFIKIQQLTGTLSPEGYKNLAKVCLSLGKNECAKTAYLGLYKQARQVDGLAEYAYISSRLGETAVAQQVYGDYFRLGGKDGEAALRYAKLLEQAGREDEAIQFYDLSIQYRPMVLPIQATTGIVRIKMKQGLYEEAYELLMAFHQSAGNAKGFLNSELTQLENYFATQPNKALKAKYAKRQ